MLQPFFNLGGTGGVGAVVHNLAFRFNHLSLAFRACRALFLLIVYLFQEVEFLFLPGALAFDWFDDFGYYLAGSLDKDPVAFTDILAPDVIFIMQGGLFNSYPSH